MSDHMILLHHIDNQGGTEWIDRVYKGSYITKLKKFLKFSQMNWYFSSSFGNLVIYEYTKDGDQKKYNEICINQDLLLNETQITEMNIGEQINVVRNININEQFKNIGYLFLVLFNVPLERQDEFNQWYDEEHVPILIKNQHWLMCRRFNIKYSNPNRWSHLALHYLNSKEALVSDEIKDSRNTKWRIRLSQEEWFQKGKFLLYEKITGGGIYE